MTRAHIATSQESRSSRLEPACAAAEMAWKAITPCAGQDVPSALRNNPIAPSRSPGPRIGGEMKATGRSAASDRAVDFTVLDNAGHLERRHSLIDSEGGGRGQGIRYQGNRQPRPRVMDHSGRLRRNPFLFGEAGCGPTQEEAQLAINTLRPVLTDLGTVIVIEPAV
jgi:hypothetical protein